MKYKVICVGKIKEAFYRDEIDSICKRIRKAGNEINIIELPDIKIPDNIKENGKSKLIEKECEPMRSKLDKQDYLIALCIEGRELTTDKHRHYIMNACDMGKTCITYVIGGSLGLADWVKDRADIRLSFSKMTLPHQLMRVVLLQEIERVSL